MKDSTFLGLASNERKEQNIMLLRQAFNQQKVITVEAAAKYFAMSQATILKWCREGNIPLLAEGQPVVEMSPENRPSWLN